MNVEVQSHSDGTLRFVAPDKGTITTLYYVHLGLLYHLARPDMSWTSERHKSVHQAVRTLRHAGQLADPPHLATSDVSAPVLEDLAYLQKLGLITAPPYQPVHITQQGQQLMDWLIDHWQGWVTYTQQFPL